MRLPVLSTSNWSPPSFRSITEIPSSGVNVMRSTIALNGSFFNTHRMLQEYISNAYYPDRGVHVSSAALESALAK